MRNLCRAAAFAALSFGALSVATPALALSGGASCEDGSAPRSGYAPGRFGRLPPRHERPALTRAAWSQHERPRWAARAGERPQWTYRPAGGQQQADREPSAPTGPGDATVAAGPAERMQTPARPDWAARRMTSRPLRPRPFSRPDWGGRPARFDRPARWRTRGPMWLPPGPPFLAFPPPWATPAQPAAAAAATGTDAADEGAAAVTATSPATGPGVSPAEDAAPPAPLDTAPSPQAVDVRPATGDADGDGVADTTDFCAGTAGGTPVDAFGCTDMETIVLRGVDFHADSAELAEGSGTVLDNVAATLVAHPGIHVEIAGHTDSDGDAGRNADLSEQRAVAVMGYLVNAGVPPANMIARGYGADRPVAPGDTPEGRAANRRIELSPLD